MMMISVNMAFGLQTSLTFVFISVILCVNAKDWWENGNFYQIYPRSFKDSNADGIGDLNGVTEKVPYLKEIGVDGVWLSPIFKSPMVDFGYDISDYRTIQPEYGTMVDFENLAAECKKHGVRLILDFVPNHSSDKHDWFQKSIKRVPGYENYYIWHPGKVDNVTGQRKPPNNWISVFRGSAWTWNEQRKEYYFHQFAYQQPDLNFRNPTVIKEMTDILIFWMRKGVSGFRVDAIPHAYEVKADRNGDYPDEPLSGNCNDAADYCYLNHIYTTNQNETFDLIYHFREALVKDQADHGGDTRILMTEAYTSLQNIQRFYGNGIRNGSQIPFNFHFMGNIYPNTKAITFKKLIDEWLAIMPKGVQSNWVLGNHDNERMASRFGEKRTDLYNILLKTLPGISVNYNGEEIGMTSTIIPWKQTVDPPALNAGEEKYHMFSRDFHRTPFHWEDSPNAGFSKGNKTWLPINSNYYYTNVQVQRKHQLSHLNVYKKLVQLRKNSAFVNGTYEGTVLNDDIFAFKRQSSGNIFVVVMNFGKQWNIVNLSQAFKLPQNLRVVVGSVYSQYKEGEIVNGTKLAIPDDIGLVLSV